MRLYTWYDEPESDYDGLYEEHEIVLNVDGNDCRTGIHYERMQVPSDKLCNCCEESDSVMYVSADGQTRYCLACVGFTSEVDDPLYTF